MKLKALHIIYADTFGEEIIAEMKKMGVKAYTIIPELYGRGLSTDPRFNNHVWPGKNLMMIILCDEKSAGIIMDRMNALRRENPLEAIAFWSTVVSDISEHDKTNPL
ncbi:MAG TPA: hypothetical protein ENN72_04740 [Firmicutes bacterium]|nr:hypothetical protein [Bacillota bacterium]